MILSMLFGSVMGSSGEEGSAWKVVPSDLKSQNSEKHSHTSGKHDDHNYDSISLCGTQRAPSLVAETINRSDRGRRAGDGEESLFSKIPIQTPTEEENARRIAEEKIRFLQETNISKESQEEEVGPEMEKGQLVQERLDLLEQIARLREREEELLVGLNKFRKENDKLQRKLALELGEITKCKEKLEARASVIRDYIEKTSFLEQNVTAKNAEIQACKQEAVRLANEHQEALDKLAEEHKKEMAKLAEEHKEALAKKDKKIEQKEQELAAKEAERKSTKELEQKEQELNNKLDEKMKLIENQNASLTVKNEQMNAQRPVAITQYNTYLTGQNGKLSFDEYLVALGAATCAAFLKARGERDAMEASHIVAMRIIDLKIQKCVYERNAEFARWWIKNYGQLSGVMPSVINGILDPEIKSPTANDES